MSLSEILLIKSVLVITVIFAVMCRNVCNSKMVGIDTTQCLQK